MKLKIQAASRRVLLIAAFCCPGVASAQSGSTDPDYPAPLIPVSVVKPDGSTTLIAAATPSAPLPVLRESLEAKSKSTLAFNKVPGGVVFGLDAHFDSPELATRWADARIQRGDTSWILVARDGTTLRLPSDKASFVGAALALARSEKLGDWLVDISETGGVSLALPLRNTLAGITAVRADLVPQFYLPVYAGGKSLIVDKDVRLLVRGDQLAMEADLEVRFFRPGRNLTGAEYAECVGTIPLTCRNDPSSDAPVLSAPDGGKMAKIAADLDRLSALAGWIGFFRWAVVANVAGLEELEHELAQSAVPVRTPVRINRKDRFTWITGTQLREPAEIPEWMREHRAKALEQPKDK